MVGLNTRRLSCILLAIMLLLTIVMVSGCVSNGNTGQNNIPAVTYSPTTTPTPTPVPTTVVRQQSADVYILNVGDKGIYNFSFIKNSQTQTETFITEVANDGNSTASNVTLTLTETDAHGGNLLIQQNYQVGDMTRGARKVCTLTTDPHDLASSVYITISLEWGTSGEFYNPTTFINEAKTIWA